MARKKRDFDYMELYNPDYRAMKANIFSGEEGSSTLDLMGNNGINTDWTFGQQQNNITAPNTMYSNITTVNDGTPAGSYVDPLQTEYHRVNPIKYLTMSEAERMRQNQLRQEARQERRENKQELTQQDSNQSNLGASLTNAIPAAANAMIAAFQDKNANTATKVATALGAPELGKIWSADWDKGNEQLELMQNRINDATNRYIQDSNDTQGAFNAIKENNKLNLIDTNPAKQLSWKDFRGNLFKKGAVSTLQGAASGSIGGPWGALGGATVGTLGALFGGIGAKKRAKRAYNEYMDKMDYLQRFAGNFNSFQRLNQQQSNENLLNNGLQQQRIQDLSNIRAYGGNLDMNDLSPNLIDLQNKSLDNQKYKYINQLQPIGFIDGGSGKTPTNGGYPRFALGGYLNTFDFGGSMNGMDIPTGMQSYENGGTHEENPNGGIQVGVDNQGTPNLVEEGEFRWGDYVFSNRIDVDLDVLSDFNVPATKRQGKKANKGKLSYADLAKKMAKKAGDLNDPITKDTLNENMKRASQAQDFQKAQMNSDNQLADYKNALKNQTQGNPMYGSMKYSGIGNVNQGLNEGSSAMEGVDNSSLSNVNRSGNEMMAAYGGNLFANGGRRRRNTVDLGYGQDYIPDLSDYKNAYYGNWGNNYAINSGVYDNGPHNAADLAGTEYAYLTNRINDSLPTYQQNVYIPNEYGQGLNYAGTVPMTDYGTIMQTRKLVEPEPEIIRQTNPMQIPVEMSTMRPINFGTTQNNTSTNTSSPTNGSSYSSTSYKYSTQTPQKTGSEDYTDPLTPAESTQEGLPSSKDQAGIVDNRNLDEKHAQFAPATTPTVPTLNTKGLYAQLGKGWTKNLWNLAGLANTEYNPNNKPEQDLRALGKTGYVGRTDDHSGMYREANLFDINLANNAAQAQAAATARAMSNVNDRNQRAANQLAADYNAMLGVGNNYQTMFNTNAASRRDAYTDNKQTEQTNVAANNDMYRDNQQAGIQAKNFELSANTEANKMQWIKDQYADTQNRIAALNKQSDAARMADNQINFLVDKAKENAYYNLKNKDPRQMYWNDPSTGEWYFKGDNGYYNNLRRAMSDKKINSLDTTSNEELAAIADQKGWNNITEEDMKDIIDRQAEREKKISDDKKAKDAQDLRNAQIQYKQMLANIRAVNSDYNPGFKDSDFTTADDWLTGYNGLNTYWLSAINPYLANRKVDNENALGGKIKTNKRNKNHSYDYMAI